MRFALKLICPLLLLHAAAPLPGQSAETNSPIHIPRIEPFPALVAAAQSNQILLSGTDAPIAERQLQAGDSVTALIAFHEKNAKQTQWLLHLQVVPPDAKDQADKPPPPMVLFTSTGAKLEFTNTPAFVNLRTLGPFAEPNAKRRAPKLRDEAERVTLNEGFLGLGLDKSSEAVLRMNATRPPDLKGGFSFGGKPFSDDEVKAGRALAEALQLSEAEQRALAGAGPALMSYFSIVHQTAGLEDILFKLLDLPSFWSILRRGGVSTHFRMESKRIAPAPAVDWELPANTPLYHLPLVLELNNQPALNITLAVTSPQSPLLACAGVVGLVAERPGDKERFLVVRIVSARRTGSGNWPD